jgi:hypothetical protein
MIEFKSSEKLRQKINESLGYDWCSEFQDIRKNLADKARAATRNQLFTSNDNNWYINEGGGTEIQYHLVCDFESMEIRYGLGFNAQYVPFNNEKSPVDYIQPFIQAFLRNEKACSDIMPDYQLLEEGRQNLLNPQVGQYSLWGKAVPIKGDEKLFSISDRNFDILIKNLKASLAAYKLIYTESKKIAKEGIFMLNIILHLKTSKNLILTGAPGTGKTFLAKELARKLIFDNVDENLLSEDQKEDFKNRCGFVQFHPSYDYTDFVEGLRPTPPDNNGNIGFERKDGVFKDFCKQALKGTIINEIDNFDEAWENLIKDLNENNFINIQLISGKGEFRIELNEYGTGLTTRTYENDEYKKGAWIDGRSKFFNKEQIYNVYRGLPGVPKGGFDNYRKAIVDYLKKQYKLQNYKKGISSSTKEQQPYVFIIDEINRGEISKIFGELFFSVDPGYRGIKGKVQTQYQNMITDIKYPFFDGFYIPENVYIIGTMNDIDRSVESIDFAMRRRFTWIEITAKESADNMKLSKECQNKMEALNNKIAEIEGLGTAFQIGGAYFLKKDEKGDVIKDSQGNPVEPDFSELWKLHLEPLLKEYLRGFENSSETLQILENAYTSKTSTNSLVDNTGEWASINENN